MWLLDVNLPTALTRVLRTHDVSAETAVERGWRDLTNGALAEAASRAGFLVVLTRDRRFGASAQVRYRVAFYGSTPAYWPVLEVHGLQELGQKLNVMSKTGQWDKMAGEISDDVLHLFCAAGTHREIAREIERRFGGAADTVALSGGYGMRQDIPPDLIQDIRRITSPFTGHQTTW